MVKIKPLINYSFAKGLEAIDLAGLSLTFRYESGENRRFQIESESGRGKLLPGSSFSRFQSYHRIKKKWPGEERKAAMYLPTEIRTTTLPTKHSLSRSPLGRGVLPITLPIALLWLALSPLARAVTPAPDGGYPNGNTAEGDNALLNLTTGSSNTAIGFDALFSNTSSFGNTASGFEALYNNNAELNTATGFVALFHNTSGSENTATGANTLGRNTTGNDNTATGAAALVNNTSGSENTATGWAALSSNTTGNSNTANGDQALLNNTTGNSNTANGFGALASNTTGNSNTANGANALESNTTGILNTANGNGALLSNTIGFSNTADGFRALFSNTTGGGNTANGRQALFHNTAGGGNIALGFSAGANLTTGNNNIDIGNAGVAGESNHIRIGKQGTQNATFIAGINGVAVTGAAVVVSSSGQLGVAASSARFKEAIKPMDKASKAILALQPVTFRYKHELDPEGIRQFGLIAEQVEKVNPDLVARDEQGKPYTVRYEAVNAMLLNEFLKEHRTVQELKSTAAKQEAIIVRQQEQIEALTAGLQKVSAQVELSKPAPRAVVNNQ